MMLRNYFLINMLLVIMLGFLGFRLYNVVTYSMDLPAGAAVEEGQKSKDVDIKFNGNVPDKASFQIISQKDIFRPSRTAYVTDAGTTAKNGPIVYPKLFATIIRGSDSIAIMEDPGTKKTRPYSINNTVAGFQILQILEDRVVLLSGDEKVDIKLRADKGISMPKPQPVVRPNVEQNTVPRPAPVRRAPARTVPAPNGSKEELVEP